MMESQWQVLFNIAVGLVGLFGGWLMRIVFDEQKSMRTAHDALRKELTDGYVRRDDFKDFMNAMFTKLDRIENKIDMKADKS